MNSIDRLQAPDQNVLSVDVGSQSLRAAVIDTRSMTLTVCP